MKFKIYTLWLFYFLAIAIEYLFSIPVAIMDTIGTKLTELADTMTEIYTKAKSEKSTK